VDARQDTDAATEAAVRVGRTLREKWHLDALIDVGGMGAVYAATHRNGMRGAVKMLHRHRSTDADIAARFRREGYIANKVEHPAVVSVLDDDVDDDGSVFLVMELLAGATLRERAEARGGRLPPDEVLLAVDQLLDALAAAHDIGIVHRDVKPDNVMVTTDGEVKILDFGIARLSEMRREEHSSTVAGLPLGSPSFMSPEQARGRWDLVDVQSDVWSVGATMFTLLCGQDVHTADTVPELLAAIFSGPAPSLAAMLPDAHPELVDLVDRALQLRLADRWQDARTMQAATRRAYESIYGAPLPGAARPKNPRVSVPDEPRADDREQGTRRATTVIARDVVNQRGLRRGALAAAVLLASTMGLAAGAERDRRSAQYHRGRTHAVERGEAPSSFSASLGSASTDTHDPPLPGGARLPPASLPTPFVRSRLPPVYDRRK
jgi:serine/threonine protein kinase